MVLGGAQIPVSITTIFEYLIFTNQDNCPEWVVTINSFCVIWCSSTLLYIAIMKNLVSTKLYNFDQTSVYLKAAAFLPIFFLEQKSFLKIVYTCDTLSALKVVFISYKLWSQVYLNLFRKA